MPPTLILFHSPNLIILLYFPKPKILISIFLKNVAIAQKVDFFSKKFFTHRPKGSSRKRPGNLKLYYFYPRVRSDLVLLSCAILTAFSARRFLFPCSPTTINSILYGLPAYQIAKLQRVQNTAARLVYMIPKFTHISPYLKELHWLPVKFRIEFKITISTFQAIHGLAPKYLCELIRIKEQSSYHLRSSEEIILLQRSEKSLTRHGDRAFQFFFKIMESFSYLVIFYDLNSHFDF